MTILFNEYSFCKVTAAYCVTIRYATYSLIGFQEKN